MVPSEWEMPERLPRVAVYAFLTTLASCALFSWELWPFTGFHLFSQTRTGLQPRWELVAVDGAGERPIDLALLGRGFRQSTHELPQLAAGPPARQAAACSAWRTAAQVREVRVYRSVYQSPSPGKPFVLAHRDLAFDCRA